ncbi:Hypothetical protein I596_1052 [Dokdonella koreensis DS-123]|uniref:Uncharacterized protein n=1 Tax=Dokdonella koreensis DS-123 TaxID=1300342 RepID=A0A167GQC4_9GAMM|nr:Hypothetical protein I596_1052 [Dokdonella koreensis DS-123]
MVGVFLSLDRFGVRHRVPADGPHEHRGTDHRYSVKFHSLLSSFANGRPLATAMPKAPTHGPRATNQHPPRSLRMPY